MKIDPRLKDNADAEQYCLRIKNPCKRDYAIAYLCYRRGAMEHRPEPANISYMAAQAVRMRLDVILG